MTRTLYLALCLTLIACGEEEPPEPDGKVSVVFRPSDAPAWGEVPFPSDLYRDDAGGLRPIPGLEKIASTNLEAIAAGLSALDGFGRSTAAVFCLDGGILPGSIAAQADGATPGTFIVDIDASSPARGTIYPASARFYPSLGCLGVLPIPGFVLRPGARHAAVVLRKVRGDDDLPLAPDSAFRRIRELGSDERITPIEKLQGDALDALEELGAIDARSDVAGLAVYTTSNQVTELAELADRLRAEPTQPTLLLDAASAAPYTAIVFGTASSPNLDAWLGIPEKDETGREWPGVDNTTGIAHDAIGAVASGAFVATSFIDPTTAHFEKDSNGEIRVGNASEKIPVTIVIPKAAAPASGYPVIVNGHGLSNNRGSMLALANEFARAGFVTIGIDDVKHGTRLGIPDLKNNGKGTYEGPDGIPDDMSVPLAFFAGLSDFVAIRDNLRQTVLDQVSLVRLVQSPALDLSKLGAAMGGPAPKLDPTRVHWNGGSLGGIVGSMTIAVEPNIRAAVLEVPGGGFAHLITTNSAKMYTLVGTLLRGAFGATGDERLDEHHPLVNLLAMTMEAGDPLAYAPHALGDRLTGERAPNLLVTYARDDELLPNIATFGLIRAFGIPVAGEWLAPEPRIERVDAPLAGNLNGVTAAASEYSPAAHGLGYARWEDRQFLPGVPVDDPAEPFPKLEYFVRIEMPIREHADQIVHFLLKGEIIVTAPPLADYDDDGVLDADDAAPYDPAVQ